MDLNGQNVSEKNYDVVIVGGGGSGLRASLEISKSGLSVAVVSKVFPTRSHTCLLYTSPSPRDGLLSRMPSSA